MGSYNQLSRLMSDHPELLILRKYSELNVKNLLYYQAELAHLEVELREVESEDRDSGSLPRSTFGTSWKSLSTKPGCVSLMMTDGQPREPREDLQWQIFRRIRSVLRDYSEMHPQSLRLTSRRWSADAQKTDEALLQYGQLTSMTTKANSGDLRTLRKWLERREYGSGFLLGSVESSWDADKGFEDLCCFETLSSPDSGLTSYLGNIILHLRRRLKSSRNLPDHLYVLEAGTQQWIANGIMTVVSSVFPVLPIVILFFINRLLVRLGLILVFTAVFAGVLVFGMRLEPDKTLAITTAFAAIQVVFVGSTSNGPGS